MNRPENAEPWLLCWQCYNFANCYIYLLLNYLLLHVLNMLQYV